MTNLRDLARTSPILRKLKPRVWELFRPDLTPAQSLTKLTLGMKAPTLLDVGANIGQFGIDVRNSGYSGRIVSFEPVSSLFVKLNKTSHKYLPWETLNKALGSHVHKAHINVSNNSGLSSSLLEISQTHLDTFPNSFTNSREEVEISTLDIEVERLNLNLSETVLKVDVQGFESNVIQGGQNSIPQISFILLELSLTPLYESEETFLNGLNKLHDLGHEIIDIHRGIQNRSGALLQVDVITKSIRS